MQRRILIWAGFQRGFHQAFRIRARNERGRGDFQIKRPEPHAASQIGEGLMRDTAREQCGELLGLVCRHRRAGVTQQRFLGCVQYMRKQAARFQARRFNRRPAQPLPSLTEKKANRASRIGAARFNHAASAASRAAWSSAISASKMSSNSPSITRSILCSVRPIR